MVNPFIHVSSQQPEDPTGFVPLSTDGIETVKPEPTGEEHWWASAQSDKSPFPGWQSLGLQPHSRGLWVVDTADTEPADTIAHTRRESAIVPDTDRQNVWPCTFMKSLEPSRPLIGLIFRRTGIGRSHESFGLWKIAEERQLSVKSY